MFAITLSVSVAISMVVSLTVTAMMCAKLLKAHERNKQQNWLSRALQGGFDWIAEGYASTPRWVLRHQPLMLCVLLGTVCLASISTSSSFPRAFSRSRMPDG